MAQERDSSSSCCPLERLDAQIKEQRDSLEALKTKREVSRQENQIALKQLSDNHYQRGKIHNRAYKEAKRAIKNTNVQKYMKLVMDSQPTSTVWNLQAKLLGDTHLLVVMTNQLAVLQHTLKMLREDVDTRLNEYSFFNTTDGKALLEKVATVTVDVAELRNQLDASLEIQVQVIRDLRLLHDPNNASVYKMDSVATISTTGDFDDYTMDESLTPKMGFWSSMTSKFGRHRKEEEQEAT